MRSLRNWRFAILPLALWVWFPGSVGIAQRAVTENDSFQFVILGDRTGETEPGVYERVWREAAAENPAFVLSVGDSIQGLNDATAETEWRQFEQILTPYRRFRLYLAAGNHDIWSARSEALFGKYAAQPLQPSHPAHYSFDYSQAHFTILDNSGSDSLSPEELQFLERRILAQHGDRRIARQQAHGDENQRQHQEQRRNGVENPGRNGPQHGPALAEIGPGGGGRAGPVR